MRPRSISTGKEYLVRVPFMDVDPSLSILARAVVTRHDGALVASFRLFGCDFTWPITSEDVLEPCRDEHVIAVLSSRRSE